MTKNKNGLLPCPFCGNTEPVVEGCGSFVICRKCYTKSPLHNIVPWEQREHMTERQVAIAAWNTRALEAR